MEIFAPLFFPHHRRKSLFMFALLFNFPFHLNPPSKPLLVLFFICSYIHTTRRPHVHGQSIEVKTQLTQRDYLNMLAQKDDAHFTIFKKRRCFLVNNQYFQLDIYQEPSHPR